MYSDEDLDSAVACGVMPPEAAAALREHVSRLHATTVPDEEKFRLVTGFNDVFVSIAAILVLTGAGSLGGSALVAAASWGLAEYFTRIRRMAMPSIILAITFSVSVAWLLGGSALPEIMRSGAVGHPSSMILIRAVIGCLAGALAATLHWRRFGVPIAVACIALALAATAATGTMWMIGIALPNADFGASLGWTVLLTGLLLFGFAMVWDASDPRRETRRSDVAFWLHLAASPLIVHPIFIHLAAASARNAALESAITAIAIYVLLGIIALIVDRRALLVSALVYVLVALTYLLRIPGYPAISLALPAGIIGALLLLLSVFWKPLRAAAIRPLPERWRRVLPRAA